jgi:hypothetical protein
MYTSYLLVATLARVPTWYSRLTRNFRDCLHIITKHYVESSAHLLQFQVHTSVVHQRSNTELHRF